jgi:hypothetical protein
MNILCTDVWPSEEGVRNTDTSNQMITLTIFVKDRLPLYYNHLKNHLKNLILTPCML